MKTKPAKIRVLHIITRLIRGGADENTIFTVQGLDKNKYIVDLLVGGQSEFSQIDLLDKSRFHVLPALVRQVNPLKDLISFMHIFCLIKNNRYHIVHTHTAKAGILGRFAALACGCPIIIHTLHGSTFHENQSPVIRFIYKNFERIAAKFTHKITSVGDDLTRRYLNAHVGQADQYVTIRSGFDLARFFLLKQDVEKKGHAFRKKLGLDDADIIIGSVSRLEPRKGHVYFLDAAAKVKKENPLTKFLIAGDGASLEKLNKYCEEIGIQDSVIFLGHRDDIENVISAMDVFVLSSLWEGLPRVLVQSVALGKPIVTFDVEGAKEVVSNGENGYILPLKDTDALAEKILILANNPSLAKQMGEKGRAKVTKDWDKQQMVKKIDELYASMTCKIKNSSNHS